MTLYRFAALKDDRCYCDSEISENDKLSYTLCPIRCSKNKSQYCGGVDAMSYYVMNGKRFGSKLLIKHLNCHLF